MESLDIFNIPSAIGSIVLGSLALLARNRIAQDFLQQADRGEISKEEANKKVALIRNCGLVLSVGGTIWLVILLLNR